MIETLAHGYSYESTQRELSNMTGFLDVIQKSLNSCALNESSLSIGRVDIGRILIVFGGERTNFTRGVLMSKNSY